MLATPTAQRGPEASRARVGQHSAVPLGVDAPRRFANRRLLGLHTAKIVAVLAPRLTDADKECRAALRALLREQVLPGLAGAALTPFVPALSLHTASAMTHLDESIRRDALSVRALGAATLAQAPC